MTKLLSFVIAAVAASACAARPAMPTAPITYSCDDGAVVRQGTEVALQATGTTVRRAWEDSAGEHFVVWPHSTTAASAVEYLMPQDPHADAVMNVWDTSRGAQPVDWRLGTSRSCRVHGGYTDVLALFMGGLSLKQVAAQLQLADTTQARDLVHDAMIALQRRYYATH